MMMFDMRSLPAVFTGIPGLTEQERGALRLVADGISPREITRKIDISEDALYRLVAFVLDEIEPAPGGMTMTDVHALDKSRPATAAELDEFERLYGPSRPPDDEG